MEDTVQADKAHQPCDTGLSWCSAKHACIDPATTVCPHGIITKLLATVGKPPGGDKDVHGCIRSAGYTWCAGETRPTAAQAIL